MSIYRVRKNDRVTVEDSWTVLDTGSVLVLVKLDWHERADWPSLKGMRIIPSAECDNRAMSMNVRFLPDMSVDPENGSRELIPRIGIRIRSDHRSDRINISELNCESFVSLVPFEYSHSTIVPME